MPPCFDGTETSPAKVNNTIWTDSESTAKSWQQREVRIKYRK